MAAPFSLHLILEKAEMGANGGAALLSVSLRLITNLGTLVSRFFPVAAFSNLDSAILRFYGIFSLKSSLGYN